MANLVTNGGLALIAGRIKGSAVNEPKYVGWGTGTTAAAATDTGLETPATEARTAGTTSLVKTTVDNDTYRVVALMTCAGADKAITEIGVFDADTDGNMLARCVFLALNLVVGDSVEFTVDVVNKRA